MRKEKLRKRIVAIVSLVALVATSISTVPAKAEEQELTEQQKIDEVINQKIETYQAQQYSPEELAELKNHLVNDSGEYLAQVPKENEPAPAEKASRVLGYDVQHEVGPEFTYGSWFTNWFTANGNPAYCVQPMVITPNSGQYTSSNHYTVSDRIAKGLYYWYGGPGYETWRANFGNLGDVANLIPEGESGMTHALLSYLYDPNGNAFQGMPQGWIDALVAQIPNLDSLPDAPSGFSAFSYNVGTSTQAMVGYNYTPYGSLQIKKVSGNPDMTNGNSCYQLDGAIYQVYDAGTDTVRGNLITDATGLSNVLTLPAKEYDILEVQAPVGYARDPVRKRVTIEPNTLNDSLVTNPLVDYPQNDPVYMWVGKIDLETTLDMPQGSASLAGAQFQIKYYDAQYLTDPAIYGQQPLRSWIVQTNENGMARLDDQFLVSGDSFYRDSFGKITIPVGTITIQEIKAPAGYLLNDPTVYVRNVEPDMLGGLEAVETYDIPIIEEEVIRGGVQIEKWDSETNQKYPQGNAELSEAQVDIYNRGEHAVVVNGTTYAKDAVVASIKTDENAVAKTRNDELPYGDYEAVEAIPPEGYTGGGRIRQSFSIREDGKMVILTGDQAIKNEVIRGGVQIEKWDKETNQKEPQGSATLEGAIFDIYNRSKYPVLVDGKSYSKDKIVGVITTDQEGVAKTSNDFLPCGLYEAVERGTPSGYLNTGKLKQSFSITEDGKMVILTGEKAIKNEPVRGDLEFVKISDTDHKRLANVPFQITSKTTGESHIIVTDENGQAKTSSEWVKHSQNTNKGETSDDGIWFGELSALDDAKGALLYDTYTIEELRCKANEDYHLIAPFEIVIKRNNVVVDLGTLTDDYVPIPDISTKAVFEKTREKVAYANGKVTIIDTMSYENFDTSIEYLIKGWQMLKDGSETGVELKIDGKKVQNELTFKPKKSKGTVEIEFTFDASSLGGKELVTFEEVYNNENPSNPKLVAEHKDINDRGQTVEFRNLEISTSASFEITKTDVAYADGKITVIDTANYDNLEPNIEYLLKGWQMLKDGSESGVELTVDGKKVQSQTCFIPKQSKGTVKLKFTFDASKLGGKEIVTFEELYNNDDPKNPKLIAEHKDIQNQDQTVRFEKLQIQTEAFFKVNKQKVAYADGKVTVVDTAFYKNLRTDTEYLMKGWQMLKDGSETGIELKIDGKKVENEVTFIPKSANGTIEIEFTFDASELGGKEIVTFEELYNNENPKDPKLVAEHKDINDKDQTVSFDKLQIGTKAVFKVSQEKVAYADGKVTIVDTAYYDNLNVDSEYLLKGWQMLKDGSETGVELKIDGKKVQNELTFKPKKSKGTVEIEFTFDASLIGEKELVTFEELYNVDNPKEPKLVAEHKDIDDKDQTVSLKAVKTPEPPIPEPKEIVQTGDQSNLILLGAILFVSGVAAVFLGVVEYRKRKLKKRDRHE